MYRFILLGFFMVFLPHEEGRHCAAQENPSYSEIGVPTIDGSIRRQLDRIERDWESLAGVKMGESSKTTREEVEEHVGTLRGWMESETDKLVAVTAHRYLPLRKYAAVLLSRAPDIVLHEYRHQVDAIAFPLLKRGSRRFASFRDALDRILERYPCSTPAEEAFWKRGEIALADGHLSRARYYWESLVSPLPKERFEKARTYFLYPDTQLPRGRILGRLALLSVLQGDRPRAFREREVLRRHYPDARGSWSGETVLWGELLDRLLQESASWSSPRLSEGWATYAGSPQRHCIVPSLSPPDDLLWRKRFEHHEKIGGAVTWQGKAFVQVGREIRGFELPEGEACWSESGRLYREEDLARLSFPMANSLSIAEERLYAVFAGKARSGEWTSSLAALDLSDQGSLVWRRRTDSENSWFGGAPVVWRDLVIMAKYNQENGLHVSLVAYDAASGEQRWAILLGSVPRTSSIDEEPKRGISGDPLPVEAIATLAQGRIYLNTNIGILAAVEAKTGRIAWLRSDLHDEGTPSMKPRPFPAPSLFHHGMLYMAPTESDRIYAVEAYRGLMQWKSGPETRGVDRLMAVQPSSEASPRLIGVGDRVYWIETRGPEGGGVLRVEPVSSFPRSPGRGLVGRRAVVLAHSERFWWIPMGEDHRLERQRWPTLEKIGPVDLIPGSDRMLLGYTPNSLILWRTASSVEEGSSLVDGSQSNGS